MKKESMLDKMDRMADANAKGDGTLDFLYFRLKFAMNMIENFKSLYKYENVFKKYHMGKAKYAKANKILKDISKSISNRDNTLEFKNMDFIKSVEDKKDSFVKNISSTKPYSLRDRKFVKNLNDIADMLHYELNIGEEYI